MCCIAAQRYPQAGDICLRHAREGISYRERELISRGMHIALRSNISPSELRDVEGAVPYKIDLSCVLIVGAGAYDSPNNNFY